MSNSPGVLLVISGPSGAGKGTVCRALRQLRPTLKLSVSATTRAPREGEIDGVHYFFKTQAQFVRMREAGEFLEWAQVYGNYYGTPISFVRDTIAQGDNLLLEIDIQGALHVKSIFPDAVLVFVVPPSLEVLRSRLAGRGTESEASLMTRCAAAQAELAYMPQYDYLVINDELEDAVRQVDAILTAESCRMTRKETMCRQLLEVEKV